MAQQTDHPKCHRDGKHQISDVKESLSTVARLESRTEFISWED
jgi:hypothetical protein